jgi:hypothetical protein
LKNYYVQTLCKYWYKDVWFIQDGLLEDYGEYLVYRDLKTEYIELYKSRTHFKKSMVFDLKDFKKYCIMLELK